MYQDIRCPKTSKVAVREMKSNYCNMDTQKKGRRGGGRDVPTMVSLLLENRSRTASSPGSCKHIIRDPARRDSTAVSAFHLGNTTPITLTLKSRASPKS